MWQIIHTFLTKMAKQFYQARFEIVDREVRSQAVYEYGKREYPVEFEAEPEDALREAKNQKRNVQIRTAYPEISFLDYVPISREYNAEFSVNSGFFKGGAWINKNDLIKFHFSAKNSDEVKKQVEECQTKLQCQSGFIPMNTSIRLDSLVVSDKKVMRN